MNTLPAQKNRLHEIDILYALGAILVILGHSHPNDWTTFPGEWVEFIYSFHMPLFFGVAGFLLASSQSIDRLGYGKWLWQKALRLLTPYFILSVLALVPKYILEHRGFEGFTLQYLLSAFFVPRQNVWGHFWFLPVLFLLYGLLGLLRLAEKRWAKAWRYAVQSALLALLLALHFLKPGILWLGIQDVCDFAVYFLAGYMLFDAYGKQCKDLPVLAHVFISIVLLTASICIFKIWPASIYWNFLVSFLMLACCWEIGQLLKNCKTKRLDFIASFAFTFYIYSWPAQGIAEQLCSRLHMPWYATTPLMFAIGLLCPAAIIWLYRKYTFLHGRFAGLVLGVRR